MDVNWKSDLEAWLAPFVSALRHKVRARMCPAYVAGLIGAGDRKSIQPMAARDGDVGYDQLHHFIASGAWDTAPLEKVLLAEADRMVGGSDAWLIVDDTALPKKGEHSVGVAPQYASALGKTANCQSLVSLTLASREVPVMVGLRLFLPEEWTSDPERMARARVPEKRQAALTKPEIAIEEIDRIIASRVRFGCVLAEFWLRVQRVLPSGAERARPQMGGGPVETPERLCRRRRSALSRRQGGKAAQVQHSGSTADLRRGRLGRGELAKDQLAARHEGPSGLPVCSSPRPRRGRSQTPHGRWSRAMHAGRGGLARRRAPLDGRAEILRVQSSCRRQPQGACRHDQSQMGVRASASADEGGTRPRPLRRQILDRVTPTRLNDHDCLRFPPVPPPQGGGSEKKNRRTAAATQHAGHQAGYS